MSVIPHGDLMSSNIMFDENVEPHLGEFGLKRLLQMNGGSSAPGKVSKIGSVLNTSMLISPLCLIIF